MMAQHKGGLSRFLLPVLVAVLIAAGSTASVAPSASAAPARINGAGSSYVALAMQQWVADGQTAGLGINYLPTNSPQGLVSYGQSLLDFAATEAEFSALQASGGERERGFQYVPTVAGATAVLYQVQDKSGRNVDYLHLSPRTIARIFTGQISRWSDPAISADNAGLKLPDQAINVVYRSGQSGTTGMFYDFIANVAPDVFNPWAAKYDLPTGDTRIIQLDGVPDFAPKTQAFNGSDQIAQHIASASGLWSIGYDEFGYAVTYGASAAWVKNASGNWVLPYAENISAALESAKLRPDLSQELEDVYASRNPLAYPISSYSYMVTQCAPAPDRATCKGEYSNAGISETLEKWLRYIACDGQINMARIGYSPLPPHLSQELVNSIGRMTGDEPETLTAANCPNPRFKGSLGDGASSPPDPLEGVDDISGDEGPEATVPGAVPVGEALVPGAEVLGTGDTIPAGATGGDGGGPATATGSETAAEAESGDDKSEAEAATGGGDEVALGVEEAAWRPVAPSTDPGEPADGPSLVPVLFLLAVLLVPPILIPGVRSKRRRTTANSLAE